MKAILSEKGQVTVPKVCRTKLGLKSGMVLDFEAVKGVLIVRKVQHEDVFRKWRGKGRLPMGDRVNAYLDRIRQ
jgi:AbrB family looped-hinge helix DNA binding protein